MSELKALINPSVFAELAEMYTLLLPLLENGDKGDMYLDGALTVRHKDDYVVGRFYMDDGFWMFEVDQ